MTYLKSREIDEMSQEARLARLAELREEMLQLRAQRSAGGATSNFGDFRTTRRTIARLITKIKLNEEQME